MMEKETLRKADIFSGTAILLLGLFIISQGVQMPMKDSYAGVKNVWYVSPALLPLFIGATLSLLGVSLIRTALKVVGLQGLNRALTYLSGPDFISFLKRDDTIRFYGIVLNLLVYVFVLISRIDFFPASVLFLLVFFFMFYCGTPKFLLRLIWTTLTTTFALCLFMFSGIAENLSSTIPFPADILTIIIIGYLIYTTYHELKGNSELMIKFRRSLIIAFVAPFTIGIIFKYFLLVPMPFEGLVVSLLDSVWYADFWS
jgi:hypothetical protein